MKTKKVTDISSKLLIRLPAERRTQMEWAQCSESDCGDIQHLPIEHLAQLAALPAAKCTHVLVPAHKAISRVLVIPDEQYELTEQKLQWLADATLDEGMPALHWTIFSRQETRISVVGIDADWLESQLRSLADAGLTVRFVTFDAFCLPTTLNGWTIFKDTTGWLLNTQDSGISSMTQAFLSHLLIHFHPGQLTHYGALPEPCTSGNMKEECPIMALYPGSVPPNLLHGKMRTRLPPSASIVNLKRAAGLSIALTAGIALCTQGVIYWHSYNMQQQLSQELTHQWQRYIPENRHRSNLKTYLPKQLSQLAPAPALLLPRLKSRLASFPGLALEGVNYNPVGKSLQLFLYASDESQIQAFIKEKIYGLSLKVDKHEQGLWTLRND
ncbi:hypothetical protein AC791_06310 [Klebsiella sp. RIT-PI-d]|uniref:type II secretion system protein GspL n=1 Tax=Klebsiella sp. RIT-PI-d TaxID=1681196 RepID=UPI0006760AE2|nr:type II secretion system protein GspL [Klebsiella sp. RIT-PI-d]KNC10547.1 hypothetical protein AC791_06310 [Klebsiella sp. RIT-PI-d]